MKPLPTNLAVGPDDFVAIQYVRNSSPCAPQGDDIARYDPEQDVIYVKSSSDPFKRYIAVFQILMGMAQIQCKAAGDINRLAGANFIERVSFELFCCLAMSGFIKGIEASEARNIVEAFYTHPIKSPVTIS